MNVEWPLISGSRWLRSIPIVPMLRCATDSDGDEQVDVALRCRGVSISSLEHDVARHRQRRHPQGQTTIPLRKMSVPETNCSPEVNGNAFGNHEM